MFKNFYMKSCRLGDNVEKYGTAGEDTGDNTVRRRKDGICMPDN
jgi:hypothetical protein